MIEKQLYSLPIHFADLRNVLKNPFLRGLQYLYKLIEDEFGDCG